MSPKAVNTVPLLLLLLVFPVMAVPLPSLISGNGQVELKKTDVGSDSNIKPSEDEPAGSDVIVDPVLIHIPSSISDSQKRGAGHTLFHPSAISKSKYEKKRKKIGNEYQIDVFDPRFSA
jgi:hypothetical protein